MKRRSTAVVLGMIVVLCLPVSSVGATPPTATLSWEVAGNGRTSSLILRFDRPAGAVETRVVDSGLEVDLDGVTVSAGGLPEDVRVSPVGESTRLHIDRPGCILRSVRTQGNTTTIVVSLPGGARDASDDYAVGIGDVLSIGVYKNPDLSGEFPVAPDGSITLPLVGQLSAAGRTEAAIAEELTHRLARSYLVDPQVSVSVKAYQSQFVYITGAVPRSSRVAIRPGLTLRGALASAEVAIAPGMTVELRRANGTTTMLDATALDGTDVPLPQSGDVLVIQQLNYVSIYGEVRHPNRLVLTPGMTLMQAIAISEGLTDWANKKKIQILRKSGDGTKELQFNLNAVENHEIPDPPLRPEDVVIVGRRIL